MKPQPSTRPEAGLTLFEVGVVVAVLLILVALVLPLLSNGRAIKKAPKIYCMNNLKQVGLAYRIWEGDNHDTFPMGVSVTNGGSMEMAVTGNVVQTFLSMSNELSTLKILYCPADVHRVWAANFGMLANSNVSYVVGVDVTNDLNPQLILSGDSDFEMGGKAVKSGLASIWTNDPVKWSAGRHIHSGNLGLADGSVQSATDLGLRDFLIQTGVATNRLAIP